MVKSTVLAVIPARAGSKSIPKKNIKLLGGIPLIGYSIHAALESRLVTRTLVSTDSDEIADLARRWGAEVPFIRPADLALDLCPDLPTFQHALEWLADNEHYRPEIVVQLRPTSPFRPAGCIDEAVSLLLKNGDADSVRSVTPSGQNPYKMWHIKNGTLAPLLQSEWAEPYNMPRQDLPQTFWQTGHIDVIRTETIMNQRSMTGRTILPYLVNSHFAVDIDTPEQWAYAEFLITNGQMNRDRTEPAVLQELSAIKLLVLDFDGVMTDNRVLVDETGCESVVCSREDGLAFELIKQMPMPVVVLSSETNRVVKARCDKLAVACHQGKKQKSVELIKIAQDHGVTCDHVAYIGNDINDLECMKQAGFPVAVADAHPSVRRAAKWVLNKAGGKGAVREFVELLQSKRNDPCQ